MREKETSPFLYFYFYSFCFLDDDTWHRKDLSQQKTFQNDEGAKQHMAPSTSQAAWTFVRVDWSPAATRKDIYDSWAIGRVRRVKVRPGEGVIALPYEPSWGPKALAFTSTQAPSGVDMSAQYDEQQQPGMYPWATTQNLRRNYTSLILAAL